ncbi:22543_t:CDS:1, partial [Gigaspora rosea]
PATMFTPELYLQLPNEAQIKVQVLVDSGTFSCFIDINLALDHKLPIFKKQSLLPVEVIDGCKNFIRCSHT